MTEHVRNIPVSVESEQAVIGATLAANGSYQKIARLITTGDFYEPVHRQIWEVVSALIEKGEVANVTTATAYLGDDEIRGLDGVTPRQYLVKMLAEAPCGESVLSHARLVHSMAARRAMISLADEIQHLAYDLPVTATVEQVFSSMEKRMEQIRPMVAIDDEGFVPFGDVSIQDVLDAYKNGDVTTGLSTGIDPLDEKLGGLQDTDLIILAGRPGSGKAQPLDEPVLTMSGWTEMGKLRIGDRLASPDGMPSEVVGIYPQGRKPVFEVVFSDGRKTRACAEHLWSVFYRDWDAPRVVDTARLAEMLTRKRYRGRLSVDLVTGDFGQAADLPIHPYLLGMILGNGRISGSVRLTTRNEENLRRVLACLPEGMHLCLKEDGTHSLRQDQWRKPGQLGPSPNPIVETLKRWGLSTDGCHVMFVPGAYLVADKQTRKELLRGLMDANGCVDSGTANFITTSPQLAHDVETLVRSLGGLCHLTSRIPTYTHKGEKLHGRLAFRCNIRHRDAGVLFANSVKRKKATRDRNSSVRLNVESIKPAGEAETQCIRVSHPRSLYVTRDFIVTHNTALSTNIAVNVAKQLHTQWPEGKRNGVVGFFSLEMGGGQLKNRILSSEAGIPFWKIRRNKMDRDEATRYVEANHDLMKLPLVIDQTGGLSIAQVAIRARQLKRRSGLRLLVIDYLQLLSGTKQHDSRSFEVTEITGKLKALAKELEVPIIALSQLSRKVEERDDKRPMLSDLRESGSIEQDADSVVFVYREEYYLKDREPKNNQGAWAAWRRSMDLVENTAELIIGKNRHGGAGWCEVGFIKEFTRFESEPPPRPIQPEDAQRAEREFVPTKVGRQVQDILKGLMLLKSEPPTDEHREQDKRLSVGARVIPLDDCLMAFKDQCYPLLSDAALKTKFSEGMNNLREGRVARYSKCGDRHFCWMPGLASE